MFDKGIILYIICYAQELKGSVFAVEADINVPVCSNHITSHTGAFIYLCYCYCQLPTTYLINLDVVVFSRFLLSTFPFNLEKKHQLKRPSQHDNICAMRHTTKYDWDCWWLRMPKTGRHAEEFG
jgi:hypothetical protein